MNYYQRLQVDPKASQEVIKSAYRVLLKHVERHPDLGGDEESTKEINEAYGVVGDPERRELYDRELALLEGLLNPPRPPEYIVFCHFCGRRNRIGEDGDLSRARCGACRRKLRPTRPAHSREDHLRAFRLGMFLFEKGLHDRALREFQSAARLKPNSATYRYWLGRCQYQKRTYQKALVEFTVAVSMKPRSFQFQFWLGQTQYMLKDHGAAAISFREAAALRPEHGPTWHRLGSVYFELQEFDQAEAAFRRTLEVEPHSVQSYRWLGLTHYSQNRLDAALADFREAERLAPGDPFTQKYLRRLEQGEERP